MDTQELIAELNSLSPYGIRISNNDCNEKDFDDALEDDNDSKLNNIEHYKTKEWKVTSYFNPKFTDISYTTYDKDLNLALKEAIEWHKNLPVGVYMSRFIGNRNIMDEENED